MDKCVTQWKSKSKNYFIVLSGHWLPIPKGRTAGLAVNSLGDSHAPFTLIFILNDEVGTEEKPRKIPRPSESHPKRQSFTLQKDAWGQISGRKVLNF